jgi:hypothetical protein
MRTQTMFAALLQIVSVEIATHTAFHQQCMRFQKPFAAFYLHFLPRTLNLMIKVGLQATKLFNCVAFQIEAIQIFKKYSVDVVWQQCHI